MKKRNRRKGEGRHTKHLLIKSKGEGGAKIGSSEGILTDDEDMKVLEKRCEGELQGEGGRMLWEAMAWAGRLLGKICKGGPG